MCTVRCCQRASLGERREDVVRAAQPARAVVDPRVLVELQAGQPAERPSGAGAPPSSRDGCQSTPGRIEQVYDGPRPEPAAPAPPSVGRGAGLLRRLAVERHGGTRHEPGLDGLPREHGAEQPVAPHPDPVPRHRQQVVAAGHGLGGQTRTAARPSGFAAASRPARSTTKPRSWCLYGFGSPSPYDAATLCAAGVPLPGGVLRRHRGDLARAGSGRARRPRRRRRRSPGGRARSGTRRRPAGPASRLEPQARDQRVGPHPDAPDQGPGRHEARRR